MPHICATPPGQPRRRRAGYNVVSRAATATAARTLPHLNAEAHMPMREGYAYPSPNLCGYGASAITPDPTQHQRRHLSRNTIRTATRAGYPHPRPTGFSRRLSFWQGRLCVRSRYPCRLVARPIRPDLSIPRLGLRSRRCRRAISKIISPHTPTLTAFPSPATQFPFPFSVCR